MVETTMATLLLLLLWVNYCRSLPFSMAAQNQILNNFTSFSPNDML